MRMNWYPMSEEERNSIDEFEEDVRFGEYIPPKIDIVLIGESIPKNYNYNFYKVNTLKSPFIQIIYDVYKKKEALGEKRFKLHGYRNFLEYFKSNNNFLYDLCEVPVDHLQNKEDRKLRKEICENGESRLTD